MSTQLATAADGAAGSHGSVNGGSVRARQILRENPLAGPSGILVLLVIAFSVTNPNFMTVANLQAILDAAAVPLVIAVGLTFVIVMGSIDLSVEGVIATVSITAALLLRNSVNDYDLGWLAVVVSLGVGLAFGLLSGLVYTKLRLPSLIVTLGTWFIGLGVGSYLFPANPPTVEDTTFRSLALEHWWGLQRLDFLALAIVIVGAVVLRHSRLGRTLHAIGGSEELVALAGIRVTRYKATAFVIAGVLASVAALMLTAKLGVGAVNAGSNQLFPAISAVVVGGTLLSGGRGSVTQSAIGVLILTVLANGMILSGVTPFVQQAVVGVIIVAAVAAAGWGHRRPLRIVR